MSGDGKKICPLISGLAGRRVVASAMGQDYVLVPCQGPKCQLWIHPYTTENRLLQDGGCSLELQPQMKEGQFVV